MPEKKMSEHVVLYLATRKHAAHAKRFRSQMTFFTDSKHANAYRMDITVITQNALQLFTWMHIMCA